jgi:cytochrome c-type biogenesis protein CcmH/NrfG
LLAEEYLRQGTPDKAWAVLQQRARYGAPDTRVIALTVAAFRQAGDQQHTAEVATRLISATPLPPQPVEALCWLAHTALAAGDLPTAQRWVDLLTRYAPEYPMVTRVRRALREAKSPATPLKPSGSVPTRK